jgi:hypothetical protein
MSRGSLLHLRPVYVQCHILIYSRCDSSVQPFRAAECDSGHYLVEAKVGKTLTGSK